MPLKQNRNRMVRAGVAATNLVRTLFQTHHVQNGDVILMKKGAPPATELGVSTIAEHLSKSGRQDCLLIVVENLDDLTVVREEDMRALGWMRIPEEQKDDEPGDTGA